jgi:phage protein D
MTETIKELEKKHENFYVPAYQILVDGKNLLTQLYMEISSVQIDNTLKGGDRFSFTVNSGFDFENREFAHLTDVFGFGKSVVIYLGYKDSGKLPLMIRGVITALQTSFPAGGLPQINVSGYDLTYCMTKGKASRSWANKKDSEVVSDVAKLYGLNPVVEDTQVVHPKTEKSQQSDMEFLEKLAVRNKYKLYAFDTDLFFRKPPKKKDKAVVSLEWGKGLVSFSPEINIAEQVSKVEVRGWDVNAKKEIVGTAGPGEELERDSGGQSGAELLKSVCPGMGALKIRIPITSQQDAKRRAEALLNEHAVKFMQGSGESIGLPEIRADKYIELLGLGKLFSSTYYVAQSTHTINSSGYKTTFKVEDPTTKEQTR